MEKPIKIEKDYFVCPQEAFDIVGQESYGANWDNIIVSQTDSEAYEIVVGNLLAALKSGMVSASWHRFDQPHRLTSIMANGEFFQINLVKDCIHLDAFAGEPIECGINELELREFIRGFAENRTSPTAKAEADCFVYIVKLIETGGQISPIQSLQFLAKRDIPRLSIAAFRRARTKAFKKKGLYHLMKAGRPPRKKSSGA